MTTIILEPSELFKRVKQTQWKLVGSRQLEDDTQTARLSYRSESDPSEIYLIDRVYFYDTETKTPAFKETHRLINGYKNTRYLAERVDK